MKYDVAALPTLSWREKEREACYCREPGVRVGFLNVSTWEVAVQRGGNKLSDLRWQVVTERDVMYVCSRYHEQIK